ncbi:MAG: hypothetical protein JWR15_1216 [Prosthecobacter sp.]|nr:hypothetical protein [Prosthecobacter sp.]
MPFKRLWQCETGKFDVQYSTAPWAGGTRGRMQQQHVTGFGLTKNLGMGCAAVLNRFRAQPPQTMSARQDSQSTVVRIGIIKVQARCEHLLQQLHRWLHMRHAPFTLHGPKPGDEPVLRNVQKRVKLRQGFLTR